MVKCVDLKLFWDLVCVQIYEKVMVVLKNEGKVLLIDCVDKKIVCISIGIYVLFFYESVDCYVNIEYYYFYLVNEVLECLKNKLWKGYDIIIIDFYFNGQCVKDNYGFGDW